MNRAVAALALLLLVPMGAAEDHLPPVGGVTVEEDNQLLRIRWDAVEGAASYIVRVREGGTLVQEITRPATEATFRGVNGRTYSVTVAAVDEQGQPGPESDPVDGTPRLAQDPAFLGAGLAAVGIGLGAHYAWLGAAERRAQRKASSSGRPPRRDVP